MGWKVFALFSLWPGPETPDRRAGRTAWAKPAGCSPSLTKAGYSSVVTVRLATGLALPLSARVVYDEYPRGVARIQCTLFLVLAET